MTVHEMKAKMPIAEMLRWIAYFNESTEQSNAIDLQTASKEQLKGILG